MLDASRAITRDELDVLRRFIYDTMGTMSDVGELSLLAHIDDLNEKLRVERHRTDEWKMIAAKAGAAMKEALETAAAYRKGLEKIEDCDDPSRAVLIAKATLTGEPLITNLAELIKQQEEQTLAEQVRRLSAQNAVLLAAVKAVVERAECDTLGRWVAQPAREALAGGWQ